MPLLFQQSFSTFPDSAPEVLQYESQYEGIHQEGSQRNQLGVFHLQPEPINKCQISWFCCFDQGMESWL